MKIKGSEKTPVSRRRRQLAAAKILVEHVEHYNLLSTLAQVGAGISTEQLSLEVTEKDTVVQRKSICSGGAGKIMTKA